MLLQTTIFRLRGGTPTMTTGGKQVKVEKNQSTFGDADTLLYVAFR